MMGSPLFAAGVFGSAWMLAWSFAALAPLLLHLWNRHQHREAPWAAMTFLLAALQQQSRRMRIEQILLLLLRMAIPLVLALALADPIWQWLPSLGGSLGSRPPHHHLFIVDTSYSMGYQVDGQTRLDHARQLLAEIVSDAPVGDGFTLISMSDLPRTIVAMPAFSKDDMLSVLSGLTLRDTEARLLPTLELIRETIAGVTKSYPRLQQHRVYFVSDFGINTWESAQQAEAKQASGEIAELADVVSIDVGVSQPWNAGITALTRDTRIVTPSARVRWRVAIEEFVGQGLSNPTLAIHVDGLPIDKLPVERVPGGRMSVTWQHRFDAPGSHVIEVQLRDDPLEADNHFFEVITVREAVRVLCVEGVPGSARYVAHALAPHEDSLVRPQTIPDYSLEETELDEYACVFLCNVAQFTTAQANQLTDYLRRGRSIVLFLGDRVRPENYNRVLGSQEGVDLLPATLAEQVPWGSYVLAPGDYAHPLIEPFRGQERAGLLTTPIWCYIRSAAKEGTTSVLSFANGDPLIVERIVQGGAVTLITTAASDHSTVVGPEMRSPWTAWNAWPSFLPIVQELLHHHVGGQDRHLNVRVGESLQGQLPASSAAQLVTIDHRETGLQWRAPVIDQPSLPGWVFAETFLAGVYTATVADEADARDFAVNLRRGKESQLQKLPLADLPQQFNEQAVAAGDEGATVAPMRAATPLFRLLLGLLGGLLMVESFVAWYLGNARS